MKHLKLFFALFAMLALGVGNAWAETTISFGYSNWDGVTANFSGTAKDEVTQTVDGVKVTYTRNGSSLYANTSAIRFYKSNTLKFDAPTGYSIQSIAFTCTSYKTDITSDVGTCTATSSNLSWSGDATSVTFTRPSDASSYATITGATVTLAATSGGSTPDPGTGEGGEDPVTPTQLSTPANLTEGAITETSATLSWDAVANASNYSVTIDGKTVTANTNSYNATGLTAGTSYTWSVVAKGDDTNYTDSEAAEHTFTTTTATVTPEPGTGSETATATLTFDNTGKRTTSTTTQQIWEENGVVFTYDKADYADDLADYSNPIRLYKGTTITIACSKGKITQIEFATNAAKYVTPMVNSLGTSFGTVVQDGNNVTLTLNTPAEVIGAIALTAQVRLNSITVTYEKVVSADPVITCGNVNFGVVSANVNTTKELVVEAENLTENITAVLTSGTNFAVSGDLTTAGGTLTLSVTATEEGTYTDKLTLTSGTTIKEVEVSATVVVCQGKGTEENPYTINDVIKLANPSPTITAWVEGYIVGVIINSQLAAPDSETNTNIVLATSATETEKFVPVALPVGDIREALNLVDHSEYLGKKVAVYGTLENYYGKTGVKNVTNYQWVSTEGDVAAPVIEGDEYFEESTTITITAAEGTTIYYTIGETTPDKNANQYSESFTVNETKTINAIAYDANGNASEVTTKTFTKLSTLTCEAALSETAIDVNYIVKGYVTEINTAYSSSYNNITFSMADTQGGTPVLKAYRVKPKDTDDSTVQVGDLVKVIGKLTQYDGTNQIAQGGEYEILTESKNPIISGVETFADKTTVTITARDGLTIYYTLDNTDPTNGSNKYEAPFELTETKTVKAVTFDGTSYSDIVEKTFTKTETPTKTVAEFIEAGGTRCYLEGIVSGLAEGNSMKYGNFDLTDASGTIYVYGCLNNAGEAQKFAELGVKNGDKIKVIAEEYELYGGTKHEAKNVQYVSHISAASITIENITMEVDEVATISATVEPAEAVVTYTIKENAANAISLEDNTITALAEGTATITATVAEGATYMGNSVDFTVTVTANGQGGEEPEPVKQYYEKVTSEPTDWSGEYILVYDDGEGNSYVWNGKDEVNGYTSATRSEDYKISGSFATITIATMEGGYSVKVNGGEKNGMYVGGTSGSNTIAYAEEALLNTITYYENGIDLTSNTSVLRFNSADNQMRFRYYKAASYTSQAVVSLYKLVETPQEPEENKATVTITDASGATSYQEGFFTGAGEYNINEDVTVTATAPEEWTFAYWMIGEEIVSYDAQYTFTVTGDTELKAYFAQNMSESITNLEIDFENMVIIGGPSANVAVEVYLGIGDSNADGGFDLLSTSSVTIMGTDATFIKGYIYEIDPDAPTAKVVTIVEWGGAIYAFDLDMSATPIEATSVTLSGGSIVLNENGAYELTADWDGEEVLVELGALEMEDWVVIAVGENRILSGMATVTNQNGVVTLSAEGLEEYNDEAVKIAVYNLTITATINIPEVTVYFIDVNNWGAPINVYACMKILGWGNKLQTTAENASEPGVAMTKENDPIVGYDVYSYTTYEGFYNLVKFSGSTSATEEVEWTTDKYYIHDFAGNSGWYTREEAEALLTPNDPDYIREGLTAGNYGTICLPYGSSNYSGATFFEIAYRDANGVYLDEVKTLVAGVPYIFQATSTEIAVIYEGEAAAAGSANGLYGTFTEISDVAAVHADKNEYILTGGVIRFCEANCKVPANRAYIVLEEVSTEQKPVQEGRRRISMTVQGENEATGLDNITTTDAPVKVLVNGQLIIIREGVKYNVQGVRL